MRNALILTGVWLGILMTAYAIVSWDHGIERLLPVSLLEEQARQAESEYIHPDGLFSLSAPIGWQVERTAEYVEMTDPNASVTVWITAVKSLTLGASLDEARAAANLGATFALASEDAVPGNWTGDDLRVTYVDEAGGRVISAYARRPDQWTVVMLAEGPTRAVEALSENLEWIWSGLAIPASEFQLL
jgi:hypothetical protein